MSAAQLQQQGLAALRGGNANEAERLFLQAIDSNGRDPALWLALAFARVNQGAAEGALAAVDRALDLEPANLRALLFKADHLDRMGDADSALRFYQVSLKVAERAGPLPEDVRRGLGRAQQVCAQAEQTYRDYLAAALAERGVAPPSGSRFAESLDIACGNKPLQLQQPTRYYFPGLPQQAFYPREQFPWVAALEAQTDAIREELQAILASGDEAFVPYLESQPNQPQINDRSNVDSMDWSACYLWREGEEVEAIIARCPRTVAALAQVPICRIPGQMPAVLFSRLAPGATIAPHHGAVNTRLICHLPLIVPKDCGALRVGNHEQSWEEGRLLIFDDSMEHEAWNPSSEERVVLLFDIWRPELSEEEQGYVSQMLQAVKAFR